LSLRVDGRMPSLAKVKYIPPLVQGAEDTTD
jgi:hypothetical protein